ncbi:MAG: transcriptional regulator [Candidatus Caldarchaeum sp.]|nr:transcriptional regulator [Candidatus Caldarchaeum sp.]MCS7129145.1 transcriptional regulator [Candidatus Caldarchaeum sp.]MDW8360426.1 hypothetical protein [Candidatus Caldarchaeum sp.]
MARDQTVGVLLLLGSLAGIAVYGWLVFLPPIPGLDITVLKLTGFVAIAGVLGIVGWIGYTLTTTPPPKPLEEIEKELNEELKKE